MRVDRALLREASDLLAGVAVPPSMGIDEHWRERALAVVAYLDGLPDDEDDEPDREPTPADEEAWDAREDYLRGGHA